MRLPRKPTAAIFDLDGILLDTEPLYTQATSAITERFGYPFTWELKSRTMGTDVAAGARLVIESLGLPLSLEEYTAERVARLRALFEAAPAMPGAERWVAELRACDLPIAIGTSSIRELCDIKWARHDWLRAIEPKVCGDDPEVTHKKPAPDIFLSAAAKLGVLPQDCLVFEDSPAGVRAARSAGMQVVAIIDARLDPALVADADWIVGSYAELSVEALGYRQ